MSSQLSGSKNRKQTQIWQTRNKRHYMHPCTDHKDPGSKWAPCRDFCLSNGLVMLAAGDTMIDSPPMVVEYAHIDALVEHACLDLTAESFGVSL